MSILLGMTFDWLLSGAPSYSEHMHNVPGALRTAAAIILLGALLYFAIDDLRRKIKAPAETNS